MSAFYPSGHCPSCGSASLVVSEDSHGVVRALSCVSCKLEFPQEWQVYLGGGKIPIPHFAVPASRPSAFIKLTQAANGVEIWLRRDAISCISKGEKGTNVWLLDNFAYVRETPEQILSLIDSASHPQGRPDAPA